MESLSALNASTTYGSAPATGKSINDVNLDDFLKLMIAEMQNQDPLSPMENSEMLQQLGQMRSIGATDKLTKTLDAVLIGQNLTTATALIGKEVNALTEDGANVQGVVDRVTVANGEDSEAGGVLIHIGDESVALQNVREILPVATSKDT